MLKNYIKIALRSLWKNRLFTGINLVGLSLGLASAAVLILFIQRGLTFDTFHKDSDRIYAVQTIDKTSRYNSTVYPILQQMVKTYPEIETGTHVQGWNLTWFRVNGKDVEGDTKYVDSTFFDVFSFKLKYGAPELALKQKESVVLNSEIAESLFGKRNPVGEFVTLNDTLRFKVTGVLEEVPANSSIQFEALMPISNLETDRNFASNADWYNTFSSVYIKVDKNADVARLEAQFPRFARAHFPPEVGKRGIGLVKMKDCIHVQNPSFKWMIYGAMTIVAFIILIISINLINLNTAIAFTRAKEVAVRKVTGSTLRQILTQFWTESGIVLVASLGLAAFIAVEFLVPQFNEFRRERMQLMLSWKQDYPTILTLAGIVAFIAFLAGTYPALYLSRLDIRDTIKGKLSSKTNAGSWTKNTLIVVQFVIAFALVIGAISVRKQVSFMREAKPGFDKENLIVINTDRKYLDEEAAVNEFRPIIDWLRNDSRIKSFATSGVVPTKYWRNYNGYLAEGSNSDGVKLRHVSVGARYISTYKMQMLEGREFSEDIDKNGENNPVIINETAMKALGWKTAVGKRLRQKSTPEMFTVVGVVKDFHYQQLEEKVEPVLHWYDGKTSLNSYLTVRLHDERQAKLFLEDLEAKMLLIEGKKPFSYFYVSDEINRQYNHLDGIWKMVNFVTILSIVIAFAGIFGLITLAANQRTKEVGIRKTLGASVHEIVFLLAKDFVLLVLISVLIGMPLAYSFAVNYLQTFEYHTSIGWLTYLIVGLFALVLTIITVGLQSVRAALVNPVESLRSE